MKGFPVSILMFAILSACTQPAVYQNQVDLKNRAWLFSEKPTFTFTIDDTSAGYDLFLLVRNEIDYPNANLYFNFHLQNPKGVTLEKKLQSEFLFEKKTGKPFGKSGLGDIYDHAFPALRNYHFPSPGNYTFTVEQFMRTDTLRGILSIGLLVDKERL